MRSEVKIGILAIVAILLAFWGFKFIQGSNLFSSSTVYYVEYEDVGGLTVGTPVQISGVNVGSVNEIKLNQANRNVVVTLEIRDEVLIPKSTRAYIATTSVLGERAVQLEYDMPCAGEGDCAESGIFLQGASRGILASFLGSGDGDGESPTAGIEQTLGNAIDSLEYTLFDERSNNPIARSSRDLAATMENLKATSARLQRVLEANSGDINRTFDNLASITSTLESREQAIASIIDNADSLSGQLTELELDRTVSEVNQSIAQLRGTLDEADRALAGMTEVINDVQNGEGTLGKLITSDELYNQIDRTAQAADTLLSDIEARPYRYVPFKSRRRVRKFDRKDEELQEEQ